MESPALLRAHGLRLTSGRRAILDLFASGCSPMSADEVLSALRSRDCTVHRTTIYRELQQLADIGMLRVIAVGSGARKYESAADDHHHVLCTSCGKMANITLPHPFAQLEARVAASSGFRQVHHVMEFLGVCATCPLPLQTA